MKKVLAIINSLLLIIFISGCTSVVQLNDKLIIQGMGIDLLDDKYVVTAQSLNVKKGQDSGSEEKKIEIFKACGYSIQDAMVNIKNQSGQEPLYSQVIVLVIGEEAAKSGVEAFMNFFIRNYDFSPAVEVLVAHGTAFDILNTKVNEERLGTEKILSILKMGADCSNRLSSKVGTFIGNLKNRYIETSAAYINSEMQDEKNTLIADKIAFFKDDKFVEALDSEESKGYLLVKGKGQKLTDIVCSPEFSDVTYTITKSKSKVVIFLQEDKLVVSININVNLYVNESDVAIYEKVDFSDIEDLVEGRIKDLAKMAIKKSIIDNQSDIFGFSRNFVRNNIQYVKSSTVEIEKMLQEAEYDIKVSANLTSSKS